MATFVNPAMEANAEAPLPSGWSMRMALWLRRLVALPVSGEMPLRLEARLGLGTKKALVLVNCRGKRVLLAVSGESITPVMEVPGPRGTRKGSR